ncbi:MAG: PIG-L family deacetylase [Chloroflexota bacterium]|nr:PIG-L family deacetylase [Chloroflexota bacterium]MDE2883810.1 PIG-L family deacetylase [Chloroflexota bacterium]
METIETPERAMLVIPHPDDGESGAGGSVAKWSRDGSRILYVVCTNGDKGSSDPEMTSERLAVIREEEQRKAAATAGAEEIVFLGYGDGELEDTREFRGRLVEQVRRWKPDVVLAMDPVRLESHGHHDHRISGQAAMDACFPYARDHLHYPEHIASGLETHKVGSILLWGTEKPDVVVDIADTIETKMQALAAHESQLSSDPARIEGFVKRRAETAAERAAEHGYDLTYAELFRRINFRR